LDLSKYNSLHNMMLASTQLFTYALCSCALCLSISTLVERALQIHLFLTNKANFRNSQINVTDLLAKDYDKMDTWSSEKNKANSKPKQTQYKPNTKPIQTQFKAKQTQFQGQKMPLRFTNKGRQVLDKQMLSWYCSARTLPQSSTEVNMENKANDHP
jgi:hypothetical protein